MNEKKTVTVAGVPVTVTVVNKELAVLVGRFDPQAALGLLRVHSLSGTAAVAVSVAGEGGPGPGRTGERWVAALHPAPPGAARRQAAPGQRHKPARARKPDRATTQKEVDGHG